MTRTECSSIRRSGRPGSISRGGECAGTWRWELSAWRSTWSEWFGSGSPRWKKGTASPVYAVAAFALLTAEGALGDRDGWLAGSPAQRHAGGGRGRDPPLDRGRRGRDTAPVDVPFPSNRGVRRRYVGRRSLRPVGGHAGPRIVVFMAVACQPCHQRRPQVSYFAADEGDTVETVVTLLRIDRGRTRLRC